MEKIKFLIALVAMLGLTKYSSQAQETIITSPGSYVVPYDNNIPRQSITKIVAEKVNPNQVKIGFGWSVNFWTTPVGHSEDNSEASLVTTSLPGPYSNSGSGGRGGTIVSYISDPWIKVDGAVVPGKAHLRDFNDPLGTLTIYGTTFPIYGTIYAENYVDLQLSNVFDNSSYAKSLYAVQGENRTLIASGVLQYQITSSGTYYLQTRSGSGSPIERIGIKVVITGSTTPTVSSVTVSPTSASVEKSQTRQFTAQVTGENNPAQTVTWSVEGASASSINASGLLSVGSSETANTLVVRATSTVDASKSGTASVTVVTPQPTVYTITATSDGHSTLTPSGVVNVNAGENQTFTASYTAGYERHQLLADGAEINADTYTFTNVQANHTISLTSRVTVYTLTYHLDGGTGVATSTYTIENEATLQTPTKEGFIFQGWYDNAELSGNAVSVIPAGSTGNKEFWAKWEAIPEPDPDVHHPVLLYKLTGNQLTVKVVGPGKESFTKLTVDGVVQESWTFAVQTGKVYEIKASSEDGKSVIEQLKKFE